MSTFNLDDDFDFGFSAVSEDDFKQKEFEAAEKARQEAEEIIRQQQQEASDIIDEVSATAEEYKKRLMTLNKMIQPLLKNLIEDADTKPYIHWPDRKKKLQEFMARVAAVVND